MIPPPFSIQCLPKKYSQLGPNIAIALTVWWAKWLLLWLQGWELEEVDELWLLRSYDILQWKNIKMYSTSITKYIGIRTHLWYWLTTSFRAPYLAYDFQTMNVYFFVCWHPWKKVVLSSCYVQQVRLEYSFYEKDLCWNTWLWILFLKYKKVKKALLPKLSSLGVLKIATPCY